MNKKNKLDFFNFFNSNNLQLLRKRVDKKNMYNSISDFKYQIIKSFNIESQWYKKNKTVINNISKNINSILICGMGGSAIGGELAQIMLYNKLNIPIYIHRGNRIPNWVNRKTLVIVSSYSGNTYETIESYNQLRRKTKKIIAISSKTGQIHSSCIEFGYPIINIPLGLQPRCALGYISCCIILVLIRMDLVRSSQIVKKQIKESFDELKCIDKMHNDSKNAILSLSYKLKNFIPVIYGIQDSTSIIGLRFKNQLQENAKMISFSNNFPEINHNEIESWNNNKNKFLIIWIMDPLLNRKDTNLINTAYKLIDDLGIRQETVSLNNEFTSDKNKIARIYKTIYFLDWVSYYLALLNHVNPISIKNIDSIKKSIT